MNTGRFSLLLAVAAALHALAWAAIIPPGQGPDEEEHFAYVQFLVEERRIPTYARDFHVTEEWDRALRAAGFDRIRWNRDERARPFAAPPADRAAARRPSDRATVSGAPAQSPLYYAAVAPAYLALRNRSVVARLWAVRALGAAMAAGGALLAYTALVRLAGGDCAEARLGAGLVAAWPQAAFLAGVVNPDAFCTLLWTASFAAIAGGGARGAAVAGVLAGGAYLAKSFGFSAVLFGAGLLAVRREAGRLLAFAASAGLVMTPWIAWAAARPGGLVGLEAAGPTGEERFLDLFRVTSPWTLFSQAWGVFGWLDTPLPKVVRAGLAGVSAIAGVGLLARRGRLPAGVLAAAAAVHTAWIVASVGLFYLRSGFLVALQGRYFLHTTVAWGGMLATGLLGWIPPPARHRASTYISATAAGLALYALGVAWGRYYGPP